MASNRVTMQIEGLDELERKLVAASESAMRAAAAKLTERAEHAMGRSKAEFVPVDTGVLKNSGTVFPPTIRGDTAEVTLGYGGAAKAYAREQHERMDYQHTVGGPRYLERPVLEEARELGRHLGEAVRDGIRKATQ